TGSTAAGPRPTSEAAENIGLRGGEVGLSQESVGGPAPDLATWQSRVGWAASALPQPTLDIAAIGSERIRQTAQRLVQEQNARRQTIPSDIHTAMSPAPPLPVGAQPSEV